MINQDVQYMIDYIRNDINKCYDKNKYYCNVCEKRVHCNLIKVVV